MKQLVSLEQGTLVLRRRGTMHGKAAIAPAAALSLKESKRRWEKGLAVWWPMALRAQMRGYAAAIEDALACYDAIRRGISLVEILSDKAVEEQLAGRFEVLTSVHSGFDPQEIEKVDVDALDEHGELLAEGLWIKASRLSFHPDDDSVRLRFSHGIEMIKASEPDRLREDLAAELAERVFPESALIAGNEQVQRFCAELVGAPVRFVERLFYSNAPDGGAGWHEDVERGHLGVIYAQLAGNTAWLTASIDALAELAAMRGLTIEEKRLPQEEWKARLASEDEAAMAALDRPEFTQAALEAGWGLLLEAGDVLLLPQKSKECCCWHAVFCPDDAPGHALSFALARA